MGPHDLLCKWCSTFVGQGKKFCSIFCESRFTRNRRRRLGMKRFPSDTHGNSAQEFVSPRENRHSSNKKENPLEDVITALHMDTDRLLPERDKPRGGKNEDSIENTANLSDDKDERNDVSEKPSKRHVKNPGSVSRLPTRLKSEFHGRQDSKIPVRINSKRTDNNNTFVTEKYKDTENNEIFPEKVTRSTSLATMTSDMTIQGKRTRTAIELAKRVRSSGYGVTVNPKLRPMALKPKSAAPSSPVNQRESSAKSKSSSKTAITVQDLLRDDSRPILTGKEDNKWEISPAISEDTYRSNQNGEADNLKDSLEDEDPLTPKETPKHTKHTNRETARRDLVKIEEILREESTSSDLLDQSVLQERLSSIKRKVEYRRRGLDSRSSMGSEFDALMDSTQDLTTERDPLNTSLGASKDQRYSRLSSRTPATKTSRQYRN